MRQAIAGAGLALAATVIVSAAAAQEGATQGAPLSAIDWLSESVGAASAPAAPPIVEPPVSADAAAPTITVTPLDGAASVLAGALTPEEAGLPATLWASSDGAILADLLRAGPTDTLPALQDLVIDLALVTADPPAGGGAEALALARVDRLLDMGALAEAEALLESGDLLDPEWFRRWFDVTLLRGTEQDACDLLREHPALAPTLEARVFCLARNGDWSAAALTLGTARALGDVSPEDELLLTRFLDPGVPPDGAAPPERPTPLVFRIREAVGDLMPTTGLPLAFAHADLRSIVSWRAQIEAAERLARRGALAPEALRDVYLARRPAASGGIWDRAAAVQALEAALADGDPATVGEAFDEAWAAMGEAELQAPLARVYGPALVGMGLAASDGAAARAGLLSSAWREAAAALRPTSPEEALWRAVALAEPLPADPPDATAAAVLAGLSDAAPPDALAALVAEGRVGEAALRAVADMAPGLDGDLGALTGSLATLRALGREDTARRAALEALLLGRRP